ncbi:MAG: pyruvate dehydrogenase (acetyl-transferring) E1 component subunit alpha [Bifidobacteriaceae bacterium]|nr:pyruvate dehydrogenase (acetyl-transferring) E1 component subunit alpha [Bifidobacteriaceae bacterium]
MSLGDHVPTLQVLDPGGQRTDAGALPGELRHLRTLTPAHLIAMYRIMVRTRAVDAEATALQRRGELGLWASCLGQEAAQVGSAHALAPADYAFPSYREHGVVLARGIDPAAIVRLFRGVDHGGWDAAAHRCHTYTLVVGGHVLHAVGYAMGAVLTGRDGTGAPTDEAVLVYLGDGAMAQGHVAEALVFAASYQAPVVFFVQNNGWAISTPTRAHARAPFARRGEGFAIPGRRVDGNDALACFAATAAALADARAGRGPAIVEAVTYRMAPHTTADDPTRYRDAAEERRWATRDPVARLEKHLRGIGAVDDSSAAQIGAEAAEVAIRMRDACLALGPPQMEDLFARVYATEHQQVSAESAAWASRRVSHGAR